MKLSRQQLLLGILALIAVLQAGDWFVSSMIQGPLQTRKARTNQLKRDIEKRKETLSETRKSVKALSQWQQRSLPAGVEIARSVYRSWLLEIIRKASLRNATVDSGAPSTRNGLFQSMPVNLRVRGSLSEFTGFLVSFSQADHLQQITSIALSPIGDSGQFDISVGIETLLLPGAKQSQLTKKQSRMLAATDMHDYDVIFRNNIFGIGVDVSDPMKTTLVSAITFSNGTPLVWITEQSSGHVIKAGRGDEFDTVAMTGRILEVREQEVIVQTPAGQLLLPIGKPFAEAVPVPEPITVPETDSGAE